MTTRHLAAVLLLVSHATWAAEPMWQAVNMQSGCVSLGDLYALYPELEGQQTPQDLLRAIRTTHQDARMQSFLEFSADMEAAQGGQAGSHVIPKAYTKSNAIMVHWGTAPDVDGFLLYTQDLCKAIYGASQR
jgi:hypothetical protein